MSDSLKTISPVDGRVYVTRPYAAAAAIDAALDRAVAAQARWRQVPVAERARLTQAAVDAFVAETDAIAAELTWQMGRPIRHTPFEVRGFAERARYMAEIAEASLADVSLPAKDGFTRYIRRLPLGIVFVVAPWNYPFLTAVNAVAPALLAGNAVVLKHSAQTPLCAERMVAAYATAGLPEGLFQFLHLTHGDTERLIGDARVGFVAFTGSVAGGHMVQRAASGRFIGTGLELGGKDPAYVRPDADMDFAVENLVDGAFFNAGQSCCAIERIYVHREVYQPFLDGAVALVGRYRLGDPTDPETDLGPMVRASAADFARGQVAEAVAAGASAHIDESGFAAAKSGTPYCAPQVLTGVDHGMRIMNEETFGPAVGIMPVDSDDQAIALMNDSDYGLTASIWTADADAAVRIGDQVDTGTWFMNRCDYLDPALAWTGVKDSGHGCTLSEVGYEQLTHPKSYHLRTQT